MTSRRLLSAVAEDYGVFPREREGNEYAVNWSLANDGVVPTGGSADVNTHPRLASTLVSTLTPTTLLPDAFRNARAQLLVTRLPSKPVKGVADVPALAMTGDYSLGEAGDNLSFTEFDAFMSSAQAHLGGAKEVFVEDAALGTQVRRIHTTYTPLTHIRLSSPSLSNRHPNPSLRFLTPGGNARGSEGGDDGRRGGPGRARTAGTHTTARV